MDTVVEMSTMTMQMSPCYDLQECLGVVGGNDACEDILQ